MLGCILFTLINNKHPFQNASNLAIVNCRYQFDQSECKRYSPKLVELCAWLLAQNPDDRPTASHLEQLLQRWEDRIEEPLNLPKQVMERIEKDARLYGIPSAGRMKEIKQSGEVQASVTAGEAPWGSVDASVEPKGWQANFTSEDNLLDISNASPKKVESLPDLLG